MFDPKLKEALSRVQKPGRYTGGEPGSVYKNKDEVDVRFAFCFPDTYEVGMSFLGEKILYELLNSHENWWCERAFMPWLDMKAEMERLNLPLYTISLLLSMPNVLLTSYQAFLTNEALKNIAEVTLQNLADFFDGKPLQNEVKTGQL